MFKSSKIVKCVFVPCLAVGFSFSAFAFEKSTDEKGEYIVGSDGEKHYLLFQNSWSGTCWGGTYGYDRSKAATKENTGGWVNDTVWTFEKDATYGGSLHFGRKCEVFGILFETAEFTASHNIYFEGMPLHIGEFGIRSEVGGLKMAIYNGSGAKNLNLTASQTWTGPASDVLTSDGFLIVVNQPYNASYTNNLYAADDVVLTIAGNTFVNMLAYANEMTNAEVVVKTPAVLSLPRYTYGTGRLNARKLTLDGGAGMRFGKDNSVWFSQAPDSDGYCIGSVPLISPVQVAETIVLVNGATLKATETTTVTGGVTIVSSGAVTNDFSGTFELADNATVVRVEEGSALDMTDAVFAGAGKFKLEGAGDALIGISSDADYVSLPFDIAEFSGNLTVKVVSGTLVLEDASSVPAGTVIVTEGEGGVLVIDETGFNSDTMLGGTKNKIAPSRLLVTDTDVSGEVKVENGETLVVFGDGLGENASLKLWNGATVMFRGKDAVISSPIWSTNTVYFKSFDSSVTGKVSGVYDTAGTSTVRFTSPGLLVFSGSGNLRHFYMDSGRVDVTGTYDVYGTQYIYGGHMVVRDGGYVKVRQAWQYLRVEAKGAGGACLEIAENGVFEKVAGNVYEYIGSGNGAYESKLLITGGTFIHKYDAFNLCGGGVIEIDSGTLQTGRRITCLTSATKDNAKVIVRNGRWLITAGSAGYAKGMFDGDGECTVHIDGHGTLQYNGQKDMPDSTTETPHATWTCSEGARLKVLGSDFADATVTLRNFEADGLAFDFNDRVYPGYGVKVSFADDMEALSVGYVLPGRDGSLITSASGVSPVLNASYVVPEGVTFDTAQLPSLWHEGFSSVTVSNLVFDAGSVLRFPFFSAAYAPLSIAGALTLPSAMDYLVDSGISRSTVKGAPVIVPACGVNGAEDCVWTCLDGVREENATLAVDDGKLVFSYKTDGAVLIVR